MVTYCIWIKTTWGLNKTKKSYNSFSPDKTGAVDVFRMEKKGFWPKGSNTVTWQKNHYSSENSLTVPAPPPWSSCCNEVAVCPRNRCGQSLASALYNTRPLGPVTWLQLVVGYTGISLHRPAGRIYQVMVLFCFYLPLFAHVLGSPKYPLPLFYLNPNL